MIPHRLRRRSGLLLLLLLALHAPLPAQGGPGGGIGARRWFLRYEQPAATWNEALPVGNGRLGAMVFGGLARERLQLNEETLWAGAPQDRDRRGAAVHLPEIRRLLFAGEYAAAEELAQRELMSERWVRSYQTLGDLELELEAPWSELEPDRGDHRRELDLRSGIATTTWRGSDGLRLRREVFASAPDQVLVVRVEATGAELNGRVRLSRPENGRVEALGSDGLVLRGRADEGEPTEGVRFEARLVVLPEGGAVRPDGDGLRLEGARAMTVLLAAGTDYRGPRELARSEGELVAAAARPYPELRRRHALEHRELFSRCELDLGGWERVDDPTDQRLRLVGPDRPDSQLAALHFQYGRYLLMGSSRPGCLPANLQGIWNEHVDAPWNSDYHINVNLQMNYWPAEVAGLGDCHRPMLEFVRGLARRGAVTARELYGARGWVAHHTTDAWGFTSPIGSTRWGLWPTGGAWCMRHPLEHWRFGGSREELAASWPALAGSARFFLDHLVPHPRTGRLVCGPSMSPENAFRTRDGAVAHVVMGPAMDQSIVRELFAGVLEAADALGLQDPLLDEVRAALPRLAGLTIGEDGRLLEWNEPLEEVEPGHRHMSHLYGLYPGDEIDPIHTPELAAAARRSLDHRLANGGGHTGWSRAWMVCFLARLGDREAAHANHLALLTGSTLPNLLCDHPPFQIDGNLGGAAGLAEMLLQSHRDELRLLPALPAAWPEGDVYGLHARGGHQVDLRWSAGRLTRARLRASRAGLVRLRHDGELRVISAGHPVETDRTPEGLWTFAVTPGAEYLLDPNSR